MLRKELIISMFVGLLLICLSGVSFASDVGSEAGMNNLPASQKAMKAAETHDYSMLEHSKVGTEAGNWEYRFDAPQTSADVAAKNHQYDQGRLDMIGTEAGVDQWRGDLDCPTC